ncbi:MAG TPA: hybrid sensor histidine kinase/response regulator [Cyanobacteria bacterium UBA11149]|nr:hybrid sensor histidine kinase/response regulator [Cyanobacteria bacterium UBA11366]HBR72919.1 hybrid sensor histidine kinase/response regulator [Cyanobacteria bacterium UBA11159]HBS69030.1 hybrid sensor histidine kinase/response regulator [Cyanobacteria bacterium UBA11153]HBW89565.1 hybrid sensor histidine kinase/response regulator [Cyanobacteria bacterium UBA11149]HCA93420.1 hybrid sensor histidine kinase/response regulator [Cyanobacteria bacterium UBA9226]
MSSIAHRLETIFTALYSETLEIDIDLENQLLKAFDCLSVPLKLQITTGFFDREQALAIADPILNKIEERLGDALTETDSYIPTSAELGVNMTLSIFEVDVAEGLERLSGVLANPENYEVAGELRAQAEVFAGFGELLNLSGFSAIATKALAALEANPDLAIQIMELALSDFQASREAVLTGDYTTGGSPCEALVILAEGEIGSGEIANFTTSINPPHELLTKEAENALFSLENIFSNPPNLDFHEESNVTNNEIYSPSLPIFEQEEILDAEVIAEATSAREILAREVPSLEDIFCSTPTSFEPATVERELLPITERPENLESALQSIEDIFDSLPPIEEITSLTSQLDLASSSKVEKLVPTQAKLELSRAEVNPSTALTFPETTSPTHNLSVRVDIERLERMNNLVGELAINRNSLSLQHQQLQGAVRDLLNRFARFGSLVTLLQEVSDQMLVNASSLGSIASHSGSGFNLPLSVTKTIDNGQRTTENSHFDSLEMDRYGVLHSRLQGILEEIIQLEESVDDIAIFAKKSDQSLEQQRQRLAYLRDELMWARMLPIGEVVNRFPRVLRELSTNYNKPVNLKLTGTGVLVDKAVLEKLYDPLLHLLRNAFDHGIESPEIRRKIGKQEVGQIEIKTYHKGSQTIIEIRDDGQGLNTEKIGYRARELGLISAEELVTISNNRLWELIFEPGFSTANQVSAISGRGVGLDVVRRQLRSLKGNLSVTSAPGIGTTFTLRLPLTLTIAKLLVCFIGTTALALPSDSIEEIIIPKANQLKQSGNQRFLHWQEQLLPTYRMADLLKYTCPLPDTFPSKALVAVPSPENWALPMLIFKQDRQAFALEIDRLVTEQELVIKPFSNAISPPNYAYGCTILGDGSVIPVIDAIALLEFDRTQMATVNQINPELVPESALELGLFGTSATRKTAPSSTILIVDDSVALRQTLALTLERAGFRVLQAKDGREALERLQQTSSVNLVICDIEMPNMNGFEFLSQRRADPQLAKIPIIMLTSRSSNKHRILAMQLGATSYFTKPYLEQEFLTAIKEIISSC